MTAGKDEALGPASFRLLGQVEDLGHIGQIVERKADGLRLEALDLPPVVLMLENLEIQEPHIVAGRAHRRGDALQAEGLEPQIDLRVHERAGMDEQYSHLGGPLRPDWAVISVSGRG